MPRPTGDPRRSHWPSSQVGGSGWTPPPRVLIIPGCTPEPPCAYATCSAATWERPRKERVFDIIRRFALRGSGGIGRRASLRSLWPQGREGSSPFFRTNHQFNKLGGASTGLTARASALFPDEREI